MRDGQEPLDQRPPTVDMEVALELQLCGIRRGYGHQVSLNGMSMKRMQRLRAAVIARSIRAASGELCHRVWIPARCRQVERSPACVVAEVRPTEVVRTPITITSPPGPLLDPETHRTGLPKLR